MSNEDNKDLNLTNSLNDPENFETNQEDIQTPEFELNETEDVYVSTQSIGEADTIQFKEPKQKNKKKLILSLVASIVVICIVAGSIVLASPKIKNSIAMSTKSPNEYFDSVIDTNMEKFASYSADSQKKVLAAEEKAEEGSYDINLSLTVNPILTSSLADMGITVDNISANIVTNYNKSKLQFTTDLALNNVSLLSMLGFADIASNSFYLQVPELSSSYLEVSDDFANELGVQTSLNNDLMKAAEDINRMPAKDLEDLIISYGDVITDNVGDVQLTKNVSFDVDKTSVTYNKLSSSITEKDSINMLIQYLETTKNNTSMKNFIEAFLTQYATSLGSDVMTIDDCIKLLKDEVENASSDTTVTFNLFTDELGIIRGISFTSNDEANASEFVLVTSNANDTFAMDFHFSDSTTTAISFIGSSKKSSNGYTGEFVFTMPSDDYLADEAVPTTATISFTDISFTGDNKEHMTGNFTLSTSALPGSSISFDADYKDSVSTIVADVNVSGMSMGTLTITGKKGDFKDFTLPSSNDTIYNVNEDMSSYLEEIDIDTFLQNLSDKLGIDLLSLLYGYDSMY